MGADAEIFTVFLQRFPPQPTQTGHCDRSVWVNVMTKLCWRNKNSKQIPVLPIVRPLFSSITEINITCPFHSSDKSYKDKCQHYMRQKAWSGGCAYNKHRDSVLWIFPLPAVIFLAALSPKSLPLFDVMNKDRNAQKICSKDTKSYKQERIAQCVKLSQKGSDILEISV